MSAETLKEIMLVSGLAILCFGIFFIGFLKHHFRIFKEFQVTKERFKPIFDIDAEVAKQRSELNSLESEFVTLKLNYAQKKEVFDRLRQEVALFDEKIAFA